jgi:hypothetical protein
MGYAEPFSPIGARRVRQVMIFGLQTKGENVHDTVSLMRESLFKFFLDTFTTVRVLLLPANYKQAFVVGHQRWAKLL